MDWNTYLLGVLCGAAFTIPAYTLGKVAGIKWYMSKIDKVFGDKL